jgi:hypothetical protein
MKSSRFVRRRKFPVASAEPQLILLESAAMQAADPQTPAGVASPSSMRSSSSLLSPTSNASMSPHASTPNRHLKQTFTKTWRDKETDSDTACFDVPPDFEPEVCCRSCMGCEAFMARMFAMLRKCDFSVPLTFQPCLI